MYKDDYARGGYRVLPVVDPSGHWTAITIAFWSVLLVPVSLSPLMAMPGLVGWPYAILAGLGGVIFLRLAWRVIRTREVADARKVFFASIAHLPLALIALVIEASVRRFM